MKGKNKGMNMARSIKELDPNFKDQAATVEEGVAWIPASDRRFTVNGLPWFDENGGEFIRLPKRAKGVVREPVWELSTMPSGGRVRFKTDTTTLKLRVRHSRPEVAMVHMCAVGESGIDVYEGPPRKMIYWGSTKQIVAQKVYEASFFENKPRKTREFTLYLPVYNDLVQFDIGLDAEATLEAPSRFRLAKPVVVYGTSITQGGCSSRGANGYVPLVGRRLGVDVVNLGFSGNGRSDLEVADLIAELDMACFVNDCVGNMNLALMKERYAAFNQKIRAQWPRLPILLMTFIRRAGEQVWPESAEGTDEKNAIVLQTYRDFRKKGDRNVHLLECHKVIGFEADHPSVDGVHLTDLGFWRLANAVAPKLKTILKLK
jgi:lysophospholipase L1-like esterase